MSDQDSIKCRHCDGILHYMGVDEYVDHLKSKGLMNDLPEDVLWAVPLIFSLQTRVFMCDKCKKTEGFYSAIGRSLFPVDSLPQGAFARYDKDVRATAESQKFPPSRHIIDGNKLCSCGSSKQYYFKNTFLSFIFPITSDNCVQPNCVYYHKGFPSADYNQDCGWYDEHGNYLTVNHNRGNTK